MDFRGLLSGSAAALIAVTGARAADAPVTMVEPEPVEYVRVCDVYGTGYFYIPGTETCLKIGGYIRERLNVSGGINGLGDSFVGVDPSPDLDDQDGNRNYDVNSQIRARVEFDAREETDLGTLRAFTRLQANNIGGSESGYGTSNNDFGIDQAFIQLGGLTIGKLDSAWADDDGLYTDNDWSVGDISNNQIRYTFATNGFKLTGSVEDDGDGDGLPDFVARIGYEAAFGSINVYGVYDEDNVDPNSNTLLGLGFDSYADGGDKDGGAFALKANAELKDLVTAGSAVKVEGSYAFDPTEYASLAPGGYGIGLEAEGNTNADNNFSFVSIPEQWQIGGGYQQSFGKLTAYVSGIYGKTFDIEYANDASGKSDFWGGAVNLGYQITSNLTALSEVSYRKVDLSGGLNDIDQTRGFLELRRDF